MGKTISHFITYFRWIFDMINNEIAVEFIRDTACHQIASLFLFPSNSICVFWSFFILVFTSVCRFYALACVLICLTHRNTCDTLRTIIDVIDVNCLQLSKENLRMGLWLWLRYAINRRLRRFSPNFRYWIKCFVGLCVCDVRRRRLLMCPPPIIKAVMCGRDSFPNDWCGTWRKFLNRYESTRLTWNNR